MAGKQSTSGDGCDLHKEPGVRREINSEKGMKIAGLIKYIFLIRSFFFCSLFEGKTTLLVVGYFTLTYQF